MKFKSHYIVVRATFKKPVTAAEALAEIKNLGAMSYEDHYTDGEVETTFKMRAVKRLPAAIHN